MLALPKGKPSVGIHLNHLQQTPCPERYPCSGDSLQSKDHRNWTYSCRSELNLAHINWLWTYFGEHFIHTGKRNHTTSPPTVTCNWSDWDNRCFWKVSGKTIKSTVILVSHPLRTNNHRNSPIDQGKMCRKTSREDSSHWQSWWRVQDKWPREASSWMVDIFRGEWGGVDDSRNDSSN